MSNPVLVEVTRGPLVESRHRGAVAVSDAEGCSVLAVGDVAARVFPRSAIKALQAIALVESGAADRYGFSDEELALACASHSGEPAHVAGVERMLAKTGLDASAL
ncbi:MAG: asparaginase, partial [Xanthobacteraceae bacterium]